MRKKSEQLRDISLISQNPSIQEELERGNNPASHEIDDRLLRVDETARFLGLSVGGLYHLVSQRRIPVVRISERCIRFSKRALLRWLESLTQPVASRDLPGLASHQNSTRQNQPLRRNEE